MGSLWSVFGIVIEKIKDFFVRSAKTNMLVKKYSIVLSKERTDTDCSDRFHNTAAFGTVVSAILPVPVAKLHRLDYSSLEIEVRWEPMAIVVGSW